ncbi:MAG: amino acid ABC transporter permease [Eubacterium sp.]|jgi:His/Glu/Gln/Arg/opine family amino acid ABC transporter permease subunit|nr:amino acid ABC transporter permease [Eubacterium sp.]
MAEKISLLWSEIEGQFHSTFIKDDRYLQFIKGFEVTLLIAFCAAVIGIAIGVLVAIIKVYCDQTKRFKVLNIFLNAYLTVTRGTPIVTQLLIMYYIIFASLNFNPVLVSIITFGVNSGAYVAEIVRAGIMAVDVGQMEAGRSLGLSAAKTMRIIILPQAVKNILPALGNEFISLLKETSVVGYVSVIDLTRAGNLVRSKTYQPFFSLISAAVVYLLIVTLFTGILKRVERRLRKSDRNKES